MPSQFVTPPFLELDGRKANIQANIGVRPSTNGKIDDEQEFREHLNKVTELYPKES